MDGMTYTLKKEIFVCDFDGVRGEMYLIRYGRRQWRVSTPAFFIISELNSGSAPDVVKKNYAKRFGTKLEDVTLASVVDFLEKNCLIEGSEEPPGGDKLGDRNLWLRTTLVPASFIKRLSFLSYAYNPVFMAIMSTLGLAAVIYTLATTAPDEMGRSLLSLPLYKIVSCYFMVLLIGLFHELGHSAALMRYGGEPQRIGVAVYYFMVVFFSDVTAAWQLKQRQRVIVDLGGLYFQSIAIVMVLVANIWLKYDSLQYAAILTSASFFTELMPFIKLDGYWVLCDFLGVPNIWAALKEHFMYLTRRSQRPSEFSMLSAGKKLIMAVFAAASVVYFAYFTLVIVSSVQYAAEVFYADIAGLIAYNGELGELINFRSVCLYLFDRFTSIIVTLFLVRMVLGLFKQCWRAVRR